MRITDRLNAEHGVYLAQLGCLEGMLEEWLPAERLQCNWNVDHVHEHVGACGWCH